MIKPYSIFFIIVFLSGFSFRDQHKPKAKKTCDVLCALPMNVYTNAASASKKFLLIEDEYVLKAAFVYRFTDYIEWKSFSIDGYFHIAVLGKSQITNPLMEIARTKKVRNNQILLKEYNNLEEVNLCHILFIPKNSSITLKSVISRFESKPVLIITEHEDYGKFGSHINFVLTGNTVKFEANPEAIKKAGINISSEFLKLAAIVK